MDQVNKLSVTPKLLNSQNVSCMCHHLDSIPVSFNVSCYFSNVRMSPSGSYFQGCFLLSLSVTVADYGKMTRVI